MLCWSVNKVYQIHVAPARINWEEETNCECLLNPCKNLNAKTHMILLHSIFKGSLLWLKRNSMDDAVFSSSSDEPMKILYLSENPTNSQCDCWSLNLNFLKKNSRKGKSLQKNSDERLWFLKDARREYIIKKKSGHKRRWQCSSDLIRYMSKMIDLTVRMYSTVHFENYILRKVFDQRVTLKT